ncbi:hypothetical protein Ancab_040117 [Ancistrocladus abbreviatus]
MAYQQQPQQYSYRSPFGDTTYTKVFVGGLAWETPTEKMRQYFEQFGEILEAVIITDKNTGKSKGYGFVTFRDPESARRACADPNPVLDGRRANCNIASFGRPRPSPPRGRSQGGMLQGASSSASTYGGAQTSFSQMLPAPPPPTPFFYQPYGYTMYTPNFGYHQNLYNAQLQQTQYYPQFYGSSSSSSLGMPYQYAYSRGAFSSPSAYRISGPTYAYYPTQMEGPFNSYAPSPPQLPTTPLPPTTRHQFPSSTDLPASQQASMETEVVVVTTESSNT